MENQFEGLTAEQWREKAEQSARRSRESWERSDTDGFMSQWASDSVQREYLLKARIAENGGKHEFVALFDLDGNPVKSKYIETRYGWSWMIFNDDGNGVREFFNESKAKKEETRIANNAKKGYRLGTVLAPVSHVKAFSASAVSVGYCPIRDFDAEFEIVSIDGLS